MLRGLYSAASGMLSDLTRMDVISNNLANADSAGYKRQEVVQHAFNDLLLRRLNDRSQMVSAGQAPTVGLLGTGSYVDGIVTDFQPGPLKPTGNPLDLSLRDLPDQSLQFFAVQTPAGVRYTRTLSLQTLGGQLLNQDGYAVLGQNGPVKVDGQDLQVDESGRVIVGGRAVDQLQVVSFASDAGLQRVGQALYQATTQSGQAQTMGTPALLVGMQETSNVNPVLEMVRMIDVMRSYEAGQKAVQSEDGTLEKLLTLQA